MSTEENKPPKVKPRLKSAPKIGQVYWCDFPKDAQLPEFWKRRPVVILSYKNTLNGSVTVIPCSTDEKNRTNKWAYPLKTTLNNLEGWAICDKPSTVAVSRLFPERTGIKKLPDDEFNGLLKLALEWLPKPR